MALFPSTPFNLSPAQATRLSNAIGNDMGLTVPGTNTPRGATQAEADEWLKQKLINLTLAYEDRINRAAVPAPDPITPT